MESDKQQTTTPNTPASVRIVESAQSSPVLSRIKNIHATYLTRLKAGGVDEFKRQVTMAELRHMVNEGHVTEIEFDAVTFIQGPNANNFRFHDRDLSVFAETFETKPYLRNHDHDDIDSRDGIIVSSRNDDGSFVQRMKITTDRGIQDFAQGKMDRFSIGWDYSDITCGVCQNSYLRFDLCPHIVGHNYEDALCEIFFESPNGIETSAVNVPAVKGTHILATLQSKKDHFAKLEDKSMKDGIETTDDLVELDEHQEETAVLQHEEADQDGETNRLQVAAKAITPHVLAALLQDGELQAVFAQAFYLDDMDKRIGELEVSLQAAKQENARLAQQIDLLNGELLPGGDFYQYAHDQLSQSSWGGYRGSALSQVEYNNEQHPEPPKNMRPVRQGRLAPSGNEQKAHSKQNRRQVAGSEVLDLWGGK